MPSKAWIEFHHSVPFSIHLAAVSLTCFLGTNNLSDGNAKLSFVTIAIRASVTASLAKHHAANENPPSKRLQRTFCQLRRTIDSKFIHPPTPFTHPPLITIHSNRFEFPPCHHETVENTTTPIQATIMPAHRERPTRLRHRRRFTCLRRSPCRETTCRI